MVKDLLPAECLGMFLRIEPDAGKVYWIPRDIEWFATKRTFLMWNTRYAGQEAFTAVNSDGYRHGHLLGRSYKRHRVVFALANGHWPTGIVDHRDGDTDNDRPENLREVSHFGNACNRAPDRGCRSRFKGVSWDRQGERWKATIMSGGRSSHLGLFAEEHEAARAYDAAALVRHGEFARLNFPGDARA